MAPRTVCNLVFLVGIVALAVGGVFPLRPSTGAASSGRASSPFTNELNQTVRLRDFRGQAIAVTFFFTRCVAPQCCPRLAQNFLEAERQLSAEKNSPTNWHFLSITFDPQTDTPEMLRTYARRRDYDPNHWSFLTGSPEEIGQLAHDAGLAATLDDNFINHHFGAMIIDPAGRVQIVFPDAGNLATGLVAEIHKALRFPART
ncbi:MAG TPA: SCO family protein [Verrucomicrobiae bacterium]|nr:SCO family protein [Verrucomicrobiae bacterium]